MTKYTEDLRLVLEALAGKRFPLEDEKQTQAGIAAALDAAGLFYEREVPVAGGIIDFVVVTPTDGPYGRIGIEVKIKGGAAAITRQIARYARDEDLHELILATSKPLALPARIGGMPVTVMDIGRGWL